MAFRYLLILTTCFLIACARPFNDGTSRLQPRKVGSSNESTSLPADYSFLDFNPKTEEDLRAAVRNINSDTLKALLDPRSSYLGDALKSNTSDDLVRLLNAVYANDLTSIAAHVSSNQSNPVDSPLGVPPPDPTDVQGQSPDWNRYTETFFNYDAHPPRSSIDDCAQLEVAIMTKLAAEMREKQAHPRSLYPEDAFEFSMDLFDSPARVKWRYEEQETSSYQDITAAAIILGQWAPLWGPTQRIVVPSARMALFFDTRNPEVGRERLGLVTFDITRRAAQEGDDGDVFAK